MPVSAGENMSEMEEARAHVLNRFRTRIDRLERLLVGEPSTGVVASEAEGGKAPPRPAPERVRPAAQARRRAIARP
jgi:hypothetical protein